MYERDRKTDTQTDRHRMTAKASQSINQSINQDSSDQSNECYCETTIKIRPCLHSIAQQKRLHFLADLWSQSEFRTQQKSQRKADLKSEMIYWQIRHLRTWPTTYIQLVADSDPRQLQDMPLSTYICTTTSVIKVSWNSLPSHLRQNIIIIIIIIDKYGRRHCL